MRNLQRKFLNEEQKEKALQKTKKLFEEGLSDKLVAQRVGMGLGTIREWKRKLGLTNAV